MEGIGITDPLGWSPPEAEFDVGAARIDIIFEIAVRVVILHVAVASSELNPITDLIAHPTHHLPGEV